jgi:uncharacterized protein
MDGDDTDARRTEEAAPRGGADLPAGAFGEWLDGMRAALVGEQGSDVPCGTCTACCTSSQFVPIGPEETDALAHIPSELLFPAPRRPAGHVLLGYDERGHCPMLRDGGCTIYAHRPRACRTYDCRVLAAAGLEADGSQPEVAARVRRWRFDHPTDADRRAHEAVVATAGHLVEVADSVPPGTVPRHPTQLAVLAIEVSGEIVAAEAGVAPDLVAVRAEVVRRVRRRAPS